MHPDVGMCKVPRNTYGLSASADQSAPQKDTTLTVPKYRTGLAPTGPDASDDRRSRIQSISIGCKWRSDQYTDIIVPNDDHYAQHVLIQRQTPRPELISDVIAFAFFCILNVWCQWYVPGTCSLFQEPERQN